MKEPFFNIICCSADSIINEALKSLIIALNCNPIALDSYEKILNKLQKKDITAILVDEFILYKDKKSNIKEVFKNYVDNIPIIFLLESLNGNEKYHPYKQYLSKPINAITLKNYLLPYLSPKKTVKGNSVIKIGSYNFNKNLNIIKDEDNNTIDLTSLESRLLLTFLENINNVLSEEFLLKNVWGYSVQVNSNTIKTHIWRLRKKLSRSSSARFNIETVNDGYILTN